MAKRLLSAYASSHSLLKTLGKATKDSPELHAACLKLIAGGTPGKVSFGNKSLEELFGIVSLGVVTGVSIERPLSLFIGRLEDEIRRKNRLRTKTGSLQTLTYIGLAAFFPLFSGISATILSSSAGMLDRPAALARNSFMLVSIAYIPIVLYMASAFSHPERSFAQNAASLLPYFALASFILFVTQGYLANVL